MIKIWLFLLYFECMGGLNVTDVRREQISFLWSTVGKTTLAKRFCSNMEDTKDPCVCRWTKLPREGVHNEKGGKIGRRWVTEEAVTDSWQFWLTVVCCRLAWLIVCPDDIYQTIKPFITKRGLVVHHHKSDVMQEKRKKMKRKVKKKKRFLSSRSRSLGSRNRDL